MRHFVVTARLAPGSAPRVLELLRQGPPFDLEGTGLERHMAFVSEEELVFVFEGQSADEEVARLLERSAVLEGAVELGRYLEGEPAVPWEVFSWERPKDLDGVFFGPDPGPGDSEGGPAE